MVMKNLHVLPTDKPSKLHLWSDEIGTRLELCDLEYSHTRNTQNIYITSEEKIKVGDWFLFKIVGTPFDYRIHYCKDITDEGYVVSERELNCDLLDCKKIILTTDQDLIDNGVQDIDTEFLEWFVKNPSCEYVEVSEYFNPSNIVYGHNTNPYKIIIPKQETLEEALERLYPENIIKLGNNTSYDAALIKRKDFTDGAKWQAKRMYSEEEVIDLLQEMNDWPTTFDGRIDIREWFEQFKKK